MGDDNVGLKIAEVLSMAYTDSSLKHVLSVVDTKNAHNEFNQQNIRSKIEEDYIARAYAVLERLEPMYDTLSSSNACINRASEIDTRMMDTLTREISKTEGFWLEAKTLQKEQIALGAKLTTVQTYRQLFQLNEREIQVLDSTTEPIDDEFFETLARAKRIYAECDVLLADSPRMGEYAMSEITRHLDQGYAKLKFALDHHLKQLSGSGANMGAKNLPLRKYMALLAERPVMFKSVLTEVAATQRSSLLSELQHSLPEKQQLRNPAPVALGSLMAWVHASIVNEYENMNLLIDSELDEPRLDPSLAMESDSASISTAAKSLGHLLDTTDTRQIITEMVDSITGPALEGPLRQRITKIVLAQSDVTIVDELSGVLRFYCQLLEKYNQPTLMATFEQLTTVIERQFEHCLTVSLQEAKKKKGELEIKPDLRPPVFWETAVDNAVQILKKYESGIAKESEGSLHILKAHLHAVVDGPLDECKVIAKKFVENRRPAKGQSDDESQVFANTQANTYLLNCLDVSKTRLAGFIAAVDELEALEKLIEELFEAQIAIEFNTMKRESAIAAYETGDIEDTKFYEDFDLFLSGANFDLTRRLELFSSPSMAETIARQATAKFVEAYARIAAEKNLPRSVVDVKTLLL